MSFEELLHEHIKALNENTKALNAYANALQGKQTDIDVEHTKYSACRFCGITYKTFQNCIDNALIAPHRMRNGRREYFKESDLIALCERKKFYSGDYGERRNSHEY